MNPHILFSNKSFSENVCRDASCQLSRLFLLVYFLVLPSLLALSTYLVAFSTCLCIFFLEPELQQEYQTHDSSGLKLVGREIIEAFGSHILTKSWPNVKNIRTA